MASRILGMGDVLTLIEKAQATIDEDKAREYEQKFRKAEFDYNDFLDQIAQVKKMGGLGQMLSMLPGANKLKGVSMDELDDSAFKTTEAIIHSMTKEERSNPDLINMSRKKRIAAGAGVDINEVNRLCKQFDQTRKMMKQMSGAMGKKARRGMGGFGGMKMPF